MTTGERMKSRRKELGLSAEFVAEKLGVSPSTIYRYENGDIEKQPGDILEPLARILNTTPAFLMGWEESKRQSEIYEHETLLKTMEIALQSMSEVEILAWIRKATDVIEKKKRAD